MQIFAYYYPGWVRSREFDEWDVVASGTPTLEGQVQPRTPRRRYYLDDPEVLRWQIQMAVSAGLDGFVFCFYWDRGRVHFPEVFHTFMSVIDDYPKFEFALMWANRGPHTRLPISADELSGDFYEAFSERIVTTDVEDIRALVEMCQMCYFCHPSYLRINGKPFFAVFSMRDLFASMGSPVELRNGAFAKAFTKEVYLVGIAHALEDWLEDSFALGLDALTSYVLLPDWFGPSVQDYERFAFRASLHWETISTLSGLPYFPAVTVGWDASCRGKERIGIGKNTYPWAPVVVGVSPQAFQVHLARAIRFTLKRELPLLTITSWNEWSEGHYLEPDLHFGSAFLEAVKNARDDVEGRTL